MARWYEPTPDNIAAWNAWVTERPERVRQVAERFTPWTLYRMKSTGQRVVLCSFGESTDDTPVTLTVSVTGKFNAVAFERNVFGIPPEDLEECDLPAPGELLGCLESRPRSVLWAGRCRSFLKTIW
jgi:hypothetical protein